MSHEPLSLAAARLGCKAETLKRWCQRGLITGAVKAGRFWMIPVDITEEQLPKMKPGPKRNP